MGHKYPVRFKVPQIVYLWAVDKQSAIQARNL